MSPYDKRKVSTIFKSLHKNLQELEDFITDVPEEKGVFLIKGTMGYDVQVDGMALGMDIAWSTARDIAGKIGAGRPQTDRAGFAGPPRELKFKRIGKKK